jgi:ubiquinone/menaquinone biosynthesis C-methylase UbiE
MTDDALKTEVAKFWNAAACGERAYAAGKSFDDQMANHATSRSALEPYIFEFAKFHEAAGKAVLEIGVGMGADHLNFALHTPKRLCGIDLTERAIAITHARLTKDGKTSELLRADAENLPFPDNSFDIVYSWGVLHHTPDTQKAFKEVCRILKPGGVARIMIYHKWSIVGASLWIRYSALQLRPMPLKNVYAAYVESPGTKAYTLREAVELCHQAGLSIVGMRTELSCGDLLEGAAGQRHEGAVLKVARMLWPRRLLNLVGKRAGLFLLIEAAA